MKKLGHEFEVVTPVISARPDMNDMFWKSEPSQKIEIETIVTHVVGLSLLERLFLLPLKKLRWRDATKSIGKWMLRKVYVPKFQNIFRNADVIHYDGGGMEFLSFAAQAAAKSLNIPFVVQPSIHLGQWGHLPIDHELFRLADSMLVHSNVEKNYLVDEVGINEQQVAVVYNGIDDLKPMNKTSFRERHAIEGPIVLFIGRKTTDKGYFLLQDAFRLVRSKIPDACLVCVGPEDKDAVSGDGVIQLGYLSEEEKSEALRVCDVFCVPSEGESFGLVFLEAGRAKKAVVCRDLELFEDLLGENGQAGIYVGTRLPNGEVEVDVAQLAQQLAFCLRNREVCGSMGQFGYQNAKRFLWPNISLRFEKSYQTVIAKNA